MGTRSEQVEAIAPRSLLTERARKRLAEMVNVEGVSIAAAAVEFGAGWHTASAAAAGYRSALLDRLDHAVIVVDHFHAIKLATTAIDDVRRQSEVRTRLGVHMTARRANIVPVEEDADRNPRVSKPRKISIQALSA